MMRDILRNEIEKAVKNLFGKDFNFSVKIDGIHADYSSNVAMIAGGDPRDVAKKIKEELLQSGSFAKYFSKAEIAPPGFLNFWLSERGLTEGIKNSGRNFPKQREKISLDYLDANPTGPVHLGHARSGFYGDVLSNILEFYGHKVSREYYVNNAKSSGQIQSLGETALGRGKEYKHEQLLSILKKPEVKKKLKTFKDAKEAGFFIAKLIQKENESFLKKIAKIKFDLFFEEEKIYSSGMVKKILEMLKKANATYKKDGALWIRASQFGDTEDRVLVRSTDEPTYLLPDIGYHLDRLIKRKYDKAINIFGADHCGYGPRLKAALKALNISPERIEMIIYQMVRLIKGGKEMKMSKREGVFVALEELIKEVGLDAARFFFLMHSIGSHMDFAFDLAKERSKKNPVYYVQYAHARARSILRKAGMKQKSGSQIVGVGAQNFREAKILGISDLRAEFLRNSSTRNLILKLIQFPEIIEDIAKDYQVHRLTTYVYELAKTFTDFYENVPVLKAEAEELVKTRLTLVFITRKILEKTLFLMGISAPEKM